MESNEITFYAVVVLYNSLVSDSITIKNLQGIKGHSIKIIVVDNSTIKYKSKEICEQNQWTYISMNGNAGLSKAYNAALEFISGENSGIVVWLDDDTEITQQYFDVLQNDLYLYKDADIFVPMIQGQDDRFWSPNEYRYIKNKQLTKKTDIVSNDRFNAINSCTAVRTEIYSDYRYTEKLFLDQVDHQFFEDQRKKNRRFRKMDVIIHHNFSTRSKMESVEKVKVRYRIMIPDFLVFCDKGAPRRLLGWVKIIGWGVRESINYKKISFFSWCIKTAIKESKRKN